jgi:alkanesulfonate monooxygenase SsuD/methylene tetrahydromethanopterin reductase-like flavin-dependent oxidoreductase (luciferase family)
MKFAHFSHIWAKPGMTPHQRYEELWRELQLCDELGFDYGFCVEHHFRPDESWMSSPSLYAVGAGARTRRLRVGPMGYIVPLYHPLRLAEEIAIVDQMLGGRMELGLVPGINADYFRPFGLDYDLRKSPTLEFVDYMRAAFGEIAKAVRQSQNNLAPDTKTLALSDRPLCRGQRRREHGADMGASRPVGHAARGHQRDVSHGSRRIGG